MGKEIQMGAEKTPITKVLTEEDFDNNPELAKMGLNVGDSVEIPTHAVAQVTMNDNEEFMVPVDEVALAEEEETRIVITEAKDGTVTMVTKGNNEDIKLSEIVGLIEVVKSDVLSQNKPSQPQQAPQMSKYDAEMIQHTLEEFDFQVFPELAAAGHKPGATIELPRIAVNGILEARKQNADS